MPQAEEMSPEARRSHAVHPQLVLLPQLALRPPQYLAPLLVLLLLLEQSRLLPRYYSQHPEPLRPLIGSAHQVHGLASQPIHACSY